MLAFILGMVLLVRAEVEKAVRDEQIESVTRILYANGMGNAPHDAFNNVIRETGNLSAGLKHLQSALSVDPNNPQYNAEMAAYYALQVCGRANCGLRVRPSMIIAGKGYANHSIKKGGYQTVAEVALGMLLDNEERHKEGRRYFRKAGKMGNPWQHIYLCTSYMMEGDFTKALKEIEHPSNEVLPFAWLVHQWHGRALLRTGHYQEAETELRIAHRMKKAYPGVALSLSECIYAQGRFMEANRYRMQEAILLLPVNSILSIRLFAEVIILGTTYMLAAAARFSAARLASRPSLVRIMSRLIAPYEPYATLSEMAVSQGHITEAHDLLQRALKFGAQEAHLWGNLAAINMALGRHIEATEACARAQLLEQDNPLWQRLAQSINAVISGDVPMRLVQCSIKTKKGGAVELKDVEKIEILH